jgi:hypothetical protein
MVLIPRIIQYFRPPSLAKEGKGQDLKTVGESKKCVDRQIIFTPVRTERRSNHQMALFENIIDIIESRPLTQRDVYAVDLF